jgi:rhodanese-related sulfurtransferase
MQEIDAATLKPLLTSGQEIAFIDVREHGQYGEGHPFFAVSIPYSVLEKRAVGMLPGKRIDIVVLDNDDGVAERACRRLNSLGYKSVQKLKSGAAGWAAAGYTLFKGVNLPSKTLGELVEHASHTPRITATELAAKRYSGEEFVLLDGRTPSEFAAMNIKGAMSCPNAELGHRLYQFAPDDTTPIIINCAGRTRSIIGAQGLINQGFKNPICALENGTAGWQLAGFEINRSGGETNLEQLDGDAIARSRARGLSLMKRFAIPTVDTSTLEVWLGDEMRTTYLLDVRTEEEFVAGHMKASQHAPGGQLAQATDLVIAARGARVVLVDDTGLRAANTAVWLKQMSHDVYVLDVDVTTISQSGTGSEPSLGSTQLPEVDIEEAVALMSNGTQLIDLNPSKTFRNRHLKGAIWSIRPNLTASHPTISKAVIVTADDPVITQIASADLFEAGYSDVRYLAPPDEPGPLEFVSTPNDPPDAECIDYLFFVHDRHQGNMIAAQAYLDWETGLLDQIDAQERAAFKVQGSV